MNENAHDNLRTLSDIIDLNVIYQLSMTYVYRDTVVLLIFYRGINSNTSF